MTDKPFEGDLGGLWSAVHAHIYTNRRAGSDGDSIHDSVVAPEQSETNDEQDTYESTCERERGVEAGENDRVR